MRRNFLCAAFIAALMAFYTEPVWAQRTSTFELDANYRFPANQDLIGETKEDDAGQCRDKCIGERRCSAWVYIEPYRSCILMSKIGGRDAQRAPQEEDLMKIRFYTGRIVVGKAGDGTSSRPVGNQAAPAGTQPNLSMPKQGQPGWTADSRTGCKVWHPNPQPNDIVTWSGSCVNGFASGRGVVQFFQMGKPVEKTEGEFRNGKRHGRAILSFPDGTGYDGQWLDDKWDGWGVAKYADGTRYDGEFRNDKWHGQGIAEYPGGITYQGEFRNDRRHGRGTMIYPQGARFDGQWNDGKPNGPGTFVTADGQIFSGQWSNGCFRQGEQSVAIATTNQECGF